MASSSGSAEPRRLLGMNHNYLVEQKRNFFELLSSQATDPEKLAGVIYVHGFGLGVHILLDATHRTFLASADRLAHRKREHEDLLEVNLAGVRKFTVPSDTHPTGFANLELHWNSVFEVLKTLSDNPLYRDDYSTANLPTWMAMKDKIDQIEDSASAIYMDAIKCFLKTDIENPKTRNVLPPDVYNALKKNTPYVLNVKKGEEREFERNLILAMEMWLTKKDDERYERARALLMEFKKKYVMYGDEVFKDVHNVYVGRAGLGAFSLIVVRMAAKISRMLEAILLFT